MPITSKTPSRFNHLLWYGENYSCRLISLLIKRPAAAGRLRHGGPLPIAGNVFSEDLALRWWRHCHLHPPFISLPRHSLLVRRRGHYQHVIVLVLQRGKRLWLRGHFGSCVLLDCCPGVECWSAFYFFLFFNIFFIFLTLYNLRKLKCVLKELHRLLDSEPQLRLKSDGTAQWIIRGKWCRLNAAAGDKNMKNGNWWTLNS